MSVVESHKCDKCGMVAAPEQTGTWISTPRKDIHVCPDCQSSLFAWMRAPTDPDLDHEWVSPYSVEPGQYVVNRGMVNLVFDRDQSRTRIIKYTDAKGGVLDWEFDPMYTRVLIARTYREPSC